MSSDASDELDPELVKLRKPILQLGVLTCVAGILFSLTFAVRWYRNWSYARQTETPAALLCDNVVGKVPFDVDFGIGVRLNTKASDSGSLAFPLRAAVSTCAKEPDLPVWLLQPASGWSLRVQGEPEVIGRVRRMSDSKLVAPIRKQLEKAGVDFILPLTDVRSGKLPSYIKSIPDNQNVTVQLVSPNEVTIRATFSERLPSAAAWQKALVEAGLAATLQDKAVNSDRALFTFAHAQAKQTAETLLRNAKLFGAIVENIHMSISTTWGSLVNKKTLLDAAGSPISDVVGMTVSSTIRVEDTHLFANGFVIESESMPADFAHLKWIWPLLLAIAALFGLGLLRGIKSHK